MKRGSIRLNWPDEDETFFLNVDLDVFARSSLEALAVAFGSKVSELYVGPRGNRYSAHFELRHSHGKSADALIGGLVRLVKSLPKAARVVWNQAYRRDFNVGIQAGLKPRSYELALKPETLKLVSSVNARVVVTIYAAEIPGARGVDNESRNQPPKKLLQPAKGRAKGLVRG